MPALQSAHVVSSEGHQSNKLVAVNVADRELPVH